MSLLWWQSERCQVWLHRGQWTQGMSGGDTAELRVFCPWWPSRNRTGSASGCPSPHTCRKSCVSPGSCSLSRVVTRWLPPATVLRASTQSCSWGPTTPKSSAKGGSCLPPHLEAQWGELRLGGQCYPLQPTWAPWGHALVATGTRSQRFSLSPKWHVSAHQYLNHLPSLFSSSSCGPARLTCWVVSEVLLLRGWIGPLSQPGLQGQEKDRTRDRGALLGSQSRLQVLQPPAQKSLRGV